MLVHDHIDHAVRERPDHPAVVDADGTLTYAELGAAIDRAVGWLTAHGVDLGDRVVYAGGNDRRFLALCYATLRIGAIFVPLHPELTAPQVSYVADNAGAALSICDVAVRGRSVAPARAWREIEAGPRDRRAADLPCSTTAMLIYTSGTTGRPKGVVCPHRQVVAAMRAINACLGYRPDDVVLCRIPLSFDYGLYQALLCALTGATLVLAERVRDAGLLRFVERHGVTVVPLVPSLAQMLILLQRRHRPATAVRLFTNTGARLGRDTAAELLELFPGATYASMYGMTECKRIAILDVAEYAEHPDSVGRAIPGDTVRIVDGDGHEVPPGTVGEIVVHGATVMAGYWRTPLAAQDRYVARPDGSLELHTGDQGRLDTDGRLYFVGRNDDMLKRRGIRISLTEIENVAEQVPGVTAAVALRPDREDGPLRLAVQGHVSADEVRAHLVTRLDRARLPDRISEITAIPLTPNGKPDRAAVARLLDRAVLLSSATQTRTSHEPTAV